MAKIPFTGDIAFSKYFTGPADKADKARIAYVLEKAEK